ncbi:acyl-CoA dehydrogenase NM domain-like protein [Lentinus tigrinus ALCF2SS1-7]|uniref:acyl-CoA dehydrogenase NM domain-like protein n=1 Tax=Lentinus tigrinus ALCF2SS1-7 TaxID=1328758 RepID=UPI0011660623|nr:acyl-CoA dehydrogenase NM domain-like protein [Lentinus tigrinus ALCF2SS1-7]
MRVEDGFQPKPYIVEHPYLDDPVLPSLLERILPQAVNHELSEDLTRLGHVLVEEIRPLAPLVHAATLTQYNEFGPRVDRLHTSKGWRQLKTFAVREGYTAIAFERKYGEHSRTFQLARAMVMIGDSHVIVCPMGMTDGAARHAMKTEILPRIRPGGSDVSLTETTASPTARTSTDLGPPYILDGLKWFSSAAEGNIAAPSSYPYPTPLSNGVRMHRLKNKVGTHGVPTAELELRGTRAWLLGPPGEGVKCIAQMLNITRVHSAVHSVGSLQRARVRGGGGSTMLHALAHLTFGAAVLLGKSECGAAGVGEEARLRMLTPAVKAYAAERATGGMERAMGALGGLGLIRDASVEKIWEGTINICGLDLVRAVTKDPQAVAHYMSWARAVLASVPSQLRQDSQRASDMLSRALDKLPGYFAEGAANPLLPCVVLNYFAIVSCALYLLEHASWSHTSCKPTRAVDAEAFRRWVEGGDLAKAEGEVEFARADFRARAEMNFRLAFGASEVSAKL